MPLETHIKPTAVIVWYFGAFFWAKLSFTFVMSFCWLVLLLFWGEVGRSQIGNGGITLSYAFLGLCKPYFPASQNCISQSGEVQLLLLLLRRGWEISNWQNCGMILLRTISWAWMLLIDCPSELITVFVIWYLILSVVNEQIQKILQKNMLGFYTTLL